MPARIDWLASYPKSGNTWLRLLLANYFAGGDAPHDINAPGITRAGAGSRALFESLLGVASSDLLPAELQQLRPDAYAALAARSSVDPWVKVHDRQQRLADGRWLFPPEASRAAIYLIRNPLDVAVSIACHDGHGLARGVAKLCDPASTISHRSATQLPQHIGDWSAHVTSWTGQDAIPVLVVRYEDMLADTAAALARVLTCARPGDPVAPARIARAVRHSRIEALQAAERAHGFREALRPDQRFFRNGRAGDGRRSLSRAQIAHIAQCHGTVMARFGYAGQREDE